MYGAIIGDLAGSIYEFEQIKKIKNITTNKIIDEKAFYSDDTILTIAIIDAILNDKNYEKYLKKYIIKYQNYKPNFKPYFNTSFSPNLIKWCNLGVNGVSRGNGAMMRISPVGYMFDTEEEVRKNALLSTIPSHNSKEAIDCATLIALMIFYLRKGYSKKEVFEKLNINIQYKPFEKFNLTCNETIDNCLYAFYNSNSFEESILNTLNMGGDTDTNCAIVGSISEALYGIDNSLIEKANKIIPNEFVKILNKAYKEVIK